MSQVQINRSDVANYVPATLLVGSMFYNSADNKLYVGGATNQPVLASSEPAAIATQLAAIEAANTAQAAEIAALQADQQTTTVDAQPHSNPHTGDFWLDTVNAKLKIYTTEWIDVTQADEANSGAGSNYPVSTDELFQHLVFTPDVDEIAQGLAIIATATTYAEQYTGRYFVERDVTQYFDEFPPQSRNKKQPLALLGGIASEVKTITYHDDSYTNQLLDSQSYRVIDTYAKTYVYPAMGQRWPTSVASDEPNNISVTYTAGASEAPSPIKSAILLIAASLWENRENEHIGSRIVAIKPSLAAKDLLHPYKLR